MARPQFRDAGLTVEEYLAGENDGAVRHEYLNGVVYAMAGASERHNVIKLNIAGLLNTRVDENCRVFDGDMKLFVDQADDRRFYYPDVFVACGDGADPYWRNDATVIIEVLSPTTKRADRYEKFEAYKMLSSFREYALVEQDFQRVDVFRLDTGWQMERHVPDMVIGLASIGQSLTFNEVYRRAGIAAPK